MNLEMKTFPLHQLRIPGPIIQWSTEAMMVIFPHPIMRVKIVSLIVVGE